VKVLQLDIREFVIQTKDITSTTATESIISEIMYLFCNS